MALTSCAQSPRRRPLLFAGLLALSAGRGAVVRADDNSTSFQEALEKLTATIVAAEGLSDAAQFDDAEPFDPVSTLAPPSEPRQFATPFAGQVKPVFVYAGVMFDVAGVNNTEIDSFAFNTYLKEEMDVRLYVRPGSYAGAPETDIDEWTLVANVTVEGQGMGNPTYIALDDPLLLRENKAMAFFVNTDGPHLRVSFGDEATEGQPVNATEDSGDLVVYQGVGKRNPIETGVSYPRMPDVILGYRVVEIPSLPPSASPTGAPTIDPKWEPAVAPPNPLRSYFNYDPDSDDYGPVNWKNVGNDGYYQRFRRLRTNVHRNRCADGNRQSPRDLCQTRDKCIEFHETRMRVGQYGIGARNESIARPTPYIMHNKLRLAYKERRWERESPWPPGADFARNGFNSGTQDLIHVDLKVKSEHKLCGKQYDAEMQQYYLHKYGNLEAVSILINGDGEHNEHFQELLDYFQLKFDDDARMCEKRQRRARALWERKSGGEGSTPSLRGRSASTDEYETTSGKSISERILDRFLARGRSNSNNGMSVWDPSKPGAILHTIWFWGYHGSTTEPPCFEQVKWRVMDVPMEIDIYQLVQLKRLQFDHVDADTCRKTSTHYEESNARPVQPHRGGATYRCRRSDYKGDAERRASGRRSGFPKREDWRGAGLEPFVEGEFPEV